MFFGFRAKNSILLGRTTIKKYNEKLGLFTVLIKPKVGCSTREIYKRVDYYSKKLNYQKMFLILVISNMPRMIWKYQHLNFIQN